MRRDTDRGAEGSPWGLISAPPWTLEQLKDVRDLTDPESQWRGSQAGYSTLTRWLEGCACDGCREAQNDAARARFRRRAQGDELGGGVDRAAGAAGCGALRRADGALAGRGQSLAGSLAGAWAGASCATRMATATLHKVLAGLLVLMAAALVWTTWTAPPTASAFPGQVQAIVGLAAGFVIGAVAAVMGVAGASC